MPKGLELFLIATNFNIQILKNDTILDGTKNKTQPNSAAALCIDKLLELSH